MRARLKQLDCSFMLHYAMTDESWPGSLHVYFDGDGRLAIIWSGCIKVDEMTGFCLQATKLLSPVPQPARMVDIVKHDPVFVDRMPSESEAFVRLQAGGGMFDPDVTIWRDGVANPETGPNICIETRTESLASIASIVAPLIVLTASRVQPLPDACNVLETLTCVPADIAEALDPEKANGSA